MAHPTIETEEHLEDFYIVAPSAPLDDRNRVLKHGETFAVFDRYGDIVPSGMGEQGIYHEGTRFMSTMMLTLGKERPLFLSSTVTEDNAILTVDLTNPDICADDDVVVPRGILHFVRSIFLWQGTCYERIHVRNYGLTRVETAFTLQFQADYADIFEVRGTRREQRGRILAPAVSDDTLTLGYLGLDNVERRTRISCSPRPARVTRRGMFFDLILEPQSTCVFDVAVAAELGEARTPLLEFDRATAAATRELREAEQGDCEIVTSNEQFNDWLNRSLVDLHMMITDTPHGPYPYAGVPWFSTAFGRDGIITALEFLWVNPSVARGVLGCLAKTQATELNPAQDAEPGKILHETRRGEMAALGEIPFGLYYGSIDSTPLFVMLAGAYYKRTGDRAYIASIWENIERALAWIDTYGDADGDGFVEYARHSATGLVQQGWKDSHDSVMYADGRLVEPPVALCEVQGYVYAAKRAAASMATALGQHERASELLHEAEQLREHFERSFWSDELGTYVLALDGNKRQCKVRASNAGHCLFTGIASPEHAWQTAQLLMTDHFYSGWGIRTLADLEVSYNPMSYHNGSVWPHDNALIAAGFARYGLKKPAEQVLTALFDASIFMDLNRLPELYCGFVRRPSQGPTHYPVACAPQAWAAGAVFLVLQSSLGLTVDGRGNRVHFRHASLPESLNTVRISRLGVGQGEVDLLLQRQASGVGINVLRKQGPVDILIEQ